MNQKEPYFGSVRFFKNMILLVVVILIVTPTVCAIHLWGRVNDQEKALDAYAQKIAENDTYKEKYDELAAELEELKNAPQAVSHGAEAIDYQKLYPDFYVDTPLPEMTIEDHTMYLTFDDGPSDLTDSILEILDKKNVKATFFVVSKGGKTSVARLKKIAAQGHAIGMHSTSHEYSKIYGSVEDFLDDYYKLFTLLRDKVGVTPTVYRFPGGSLNGYNMGVYQEIIAEMTRRGFVYYDWNLSSMDAASSESPTKGEILRYVVGNAKGKNRGIVLMHDANRCRTTVAALPDMIDGLKELGFTFGTIDRTVKPMIFPYTDTP